MAAEEDDTLTQPEEGAARGNFGSEPKPGWLDRARGDGNANNLNGISTYPKAPQPRTRENATWLQLAEGQVVDNGLGNGPRRSRRS